MSVDREAYIESLKARQELVNEEIEKLESHAKKLKREEQLAKIRHHRDEAARKLRELEESTSEAWEGLRDGVENAWSALAEGVKTAKGAFGGSEAEEEEATEVDGERSEP
jgi:hypothetical protein